MRVNSFLFPLKNLEEGLCPVWFKTLHTRQKQLLFHGSPILSDDREEFQHLYQVEQLKYEAKDTTPLHQQ